MTNQEKNEPKDKDKDVYFIILNPIDNEEKINFKDLKYVSRITPSIIFEKTIEVNGQKLEVVVFKFRGKKKIKKDNVKEEKKEKERKEYTIKYISGVRSIEISFNTNEKSFVYSPNLEIGNIFLETAIPEPIEQENIPLYKKLDIFQEALEHNNETEKKEKLFEDSIDLYKTKKKFSLMVSLFLKVYENNKGLCKTLIEIFFKINGKENSDKEKDLKNELESFQNIYSKAEEIIAKNDYDKTYFYGVLFSYLHYYDKTNFSGMIKKFIDGNSGVVYDILIEYYSHFMNPLNQNQKFFDDFIKHALKKDNKDNKYQIFKRVMKYIEDIETYLFVINENKNEIFENCKELKTKPIELGPNLKLYKYNNDKTNNPKSNSLNESDGEDSTPRLKKIQAEETECDKIIKLIEDLLKFSEKEQILAVYLKVTFWINLIKQYDIPDWRNINKLYNLRELYKKYNNLINSLYEKNEKKKKEDIKSEINGYLERDEFASYLNKNIKQLFEKEKDRLTNTEILGAIKEYNPYFSIEEDIHKNKRETSIFNFINYRKITPTFITNFKNWNFEKMFEEIITDYIKALTGNIKDIHTFGNIINLIDVTRINEEKKK